jgi:hypothetical protein
VTDKRTTAIRSSDEEHNPGKCIAQTQSTRAWGRATCPRYLRAMVLAWLGLLGFATGGCDSSSSVSGPSDCPKRDFAFINLGCASSQSPVVKTTGPCSASLVGLNEKGVILTSSGAGACHVEMIFGSGATSSIDLDFMSVWLPLGSDPHGCGQGFVTVTESGSPCIACQLSVPEPMCDAGLVPLD